MQEEISKKSKKFYMIFGGAGYGESVAESGDFIYNKDNFSTNDFLTAQPGVRGAGQDGRGRFLRAGK
ncbi:hypothetical protein [uncultured Dysosmobacter sp.]|uniref:hypothetical protein n=1 Tax=uncultured Dysosmobacter sp. TaxID=2591384 RepID=UPI0026134CF6|nr:hypothetical protein [uncultured Dysosmobacter sp.]